MMKGQFLDTQSNSINTLLLVTCSRSSGKRALPGAKRRTSIMCSRKGLLAEAVRNKGRGEGRNVYVGRNYLRPATKR